jgi:hypothetical protein
MLWAKIFRSASARVTEASTEMEKRLLLQTCVAGTANPSVRPCCVYAHYLLVLIMSI